MTTDVERHEGVRAVGRRWFVRAVLTGAVAVGSGLELGCSAASPPTSPGLTRPRPSSPGSALRELAGGNQRWRSLHERHPDQTRTVRQELVGGQHPFAIVLGCVDSRVPPELVFDQGLGDLMTVRSAGGVLDAAVLASVEYGVLELGIPLVVVLGHQSCGAVTAAVHADEGGRELPGPLRYLGDQIRPAIDRRLRGEARVDAAVTANVRLVRSRLSRAPDLAERVAAGKLAVVGARYELTSQRVHEIP
ncbi:carbonic anhydrase [Streptomyces sp. NPDC001373]|uniref:carbonic anhydrase n=1 Tax=Streptomyces sp. NPDC001373 TaxID=3364565 RepID=UPI0036B8A3DA